MRGDGPVGQLEKYASTLSGADVLVTGGAGSIGRVLARRMSRYDPNEIHVFDKDGEAVAELEGLDDAIRGTVGDVTDGDRVAPAVGEADLVIHAAAEKSVVECELHPRRAVWTNVLGLETVVDAAIEGGTERVVLASSDKAANPTNVMGTTKQFGERLLVSADGYRDPDATQFNAVRFGNVGNTAGSVIPLFADQIAAGGPVTLTDDRMTRYFLTFEDVFELLMDALECPVGGGILVREMPVVRIEDLAEVMIEMLAPAHGHDPPEVPVEVVGRRPGETLHEDLMTRPEAERALRTGGGYLVPPVDADVEGYEPARLEPGGLSSRDRQPLGKAEIRRYLRTVGVDGADARP